MSTRTTKRGRLETLARLQRIAEDWRDDPDPDKRWFAQRSAELVAADGRSTDCRQRHAEIADAIGLFGRLDAQQGRIRAAVAEAETVLARREAFRRAFPALSELKNKAIDRRIRTALRDARV
jgi:hypothetical protein